MRVIYLAHPFRGHPISNSEKVRSLARTCSVYGELPLAPQIYLPQFLEEATERYLAMRLCLKLVSLSDEVRVYGDPTAGMRLEIAEAERLGIPVVRGDSR